MDIITKSFLDKFKEQYGYQELSDSDAFEYFSIYCVVSKYIKTETIGREILNELRIGCGNDWGIDGFIIILNGKIVMSKQEVDDLLLANGYLEMKIVLVQSKISETFNVAELGQSLDGVEYILKDINEENNLPASNESLSEYRNLLKYIYTKSADFRNSENPTMELYYITCGVYNNQSDFVSKISKTKKYIDDLLLTSNFDCYLLGRKELGEYYKGTKSKIEVDIKVEHKMSLPEVDDIYESYLCLIPFKEFKKLIIDSESNLIQTVFYDNIRSFQGENIVNKAMANSLKSGNLRLFTAMNNGLTVIAKSIKTTGVNIHLTDYQIVNGCQTCNVLQQNQNIPDIDNLILSVKLIASDNKVIRDKIIVGNNSQTEVKREQLVALLDTQRYIEDYYNAQNKFEKLYYERRSKQYRYEDTQIPPYKIITIPFQIKSFVSMIMEKPHQVSGYYGRIVEEFDKNGLQVFALKTNPALYYTSALACYKMENCFADGIIPRQFKKIKYHVLLAFRLLSQDAKMPSLNSNKVQKYCDHLCEILCDRDRCNNAFISAVNFVKRVLGRAPRDNDRTNENLTKKMFAYY